MHHLAQINIAKLVAPRGDPRVQAFFDNLDRINALADAHPGFVWRLKADGGNDATAIQTTPDPLLIINMSLWRDADALFDFVYRTAHVGVMAQRRQQFDRWPGAFTALWWVEAGVTPTLADGFAALWRLDRFGPTPDAFTFKARFPAPGLAGPPFDMKPDPWCIGNA